MHTKLLSPAPSHLLVRRGGGLGAVEEATLQPRNISNRARQQDIVTSFVRVCGCHPWSVYSRHETKALHLKLLWRLHEHRAWAWLA